MVQFDYTPENAMKLAAFKISQTLVASYQNQNNPASPYGMYGKISPYQVSTLVGVGNKILMGLAGSVKPDLGYMITYSGQSAWKIGKYTKDNVGCYDWAVGEVDGAGTFTGDERARAAFANFWTKLQADPELRKKIAAADVATPSTQNSPIQIPWNTGNGGVALGGFGSWIGSQLANLAGAAETSSQVAAPLVVGNTAYIGSSLGSNQSLGTVGFFIHCEKSAPI